MPRNSLRRKPKVAEDDAVGSMGELATRLEVHRNTLTGWKREGAPKGPPYSVRAWSSWAAEHGYGPGAGPSMHGVPGERVSGDVAVKLPGDNPYDEVVAAGFTYKDALEREKVRGQTITNVTLAIQQRTLEIEQRKAAGNLVSREHLRGEVQRLFDAFNAEGEQIAARVVKHMGTLSVDQREAVNRACEMAWGEVIEEVTPADMKRKKRKGGA